MRAESTISVGPSVEPRQFCTYFDLHYIHRGLALYESIQRHHGPFVLWVLCLDDRTRGILSGLKLPGVRLISREDFERGDGELQLAKTDRNRVEYYWTCTPSLPLFIFRLRPEIETLIYVDADMYFFSSLDQIEFELRSSSILINLQDLSAEYADHQAAGKFNVGVMAFRNDRDGRACLTWWREQCLRSCRYRPEEGLYGDQHMLDDWPERFDGVVVSAFRGLRAAPWNISKYPVRAMAKGGILVADEPLICFHFHALRFCTSRLVFLIGWNVALTRPCVDLIYRRYVAELLCIEARLERAGFPVPIPRSGMPFRYFLGRLVRGQPMRNFLRASATEALIGDASYAP